LGVFFSFVLFFFVFCGVCGGLSDCYLFSGPISSLRADVPPIASQPAQISHPLWSREPPQDAPILFPFLLNAPTASPHLCLPHFPPPPHSSLFYRPHFAKPSGRCSVPLSRPTTGPPHLQLSHPLFPVGSRSPSFQPTREDQSFFLPNNPNSCSAPSPMVFL